jgi:hypothetical protein
MASAYYQIALHEDDKKKTAFITRSGIFEFMRMPFGLTGAVATFQNAMNSVLSGLTWKLCLVYLDDVLVFSKSFEEHCAHLKLIFDRFREANVSLKADKCNFFARKTRYLGHVISADGIATDPRLVDKVRDCPAPKDRSELNTFLALARYYSSFVPHFSDVVEPMAVLLRKDVPWVWGPAQQAAFTEIKNLITSAPILIFPDFLLPFILHTDASDVAIGAVLSQRLADGTEHPVAFFSQTLQPSHRNWDTQQRECFSVVESIAHFRHYLEFNHFSVVTDHEALQMITKPDKTNKISGKLARWILKMQGYDYTIHHRPGI